MPGEEILSVLWVLVCTVAVLALCYYVTRRLNRLPAFSRYAGGIPREGRLEVLSRVPLGKDQSLVMAAVGKRCFLLGCAAGSVSLLTELTGGGSGSVDDTPGGEELHRAKALSGRYERAFKAEGTEGRAS